MAGTGGVIGVAANLFTVENCYVNAVISLPENSDNERVGGIIGASWNGGTLKNVQFDGVVTASGKRFRGAFIGAVGNPDKTVILTNCLNTGISAGYDNGKLLFSLISNLNSGSTTINASNIYSTSAIFLMAGKTDMVTCKSFDELKGNAAKTALTGFDFDKVWTARENQLPILTVAKDLSSDSLAAGTDFSWFKPESGETMTLTNARQLLALAKLVTAAGQQLDTLLNSWKIEIANVLVPMMDGLFEENAKSKLLEKTVAETDANQVVSVFAQTGKKTDNGSYAVRFVAEINGKDWTGAGFDLLVTYQTEDGVLMTSKLTEQAVTVCYTGVLADGEPKTAPEGHYYIVFVLNNIPASNGVTTFTVAAHVESEAGTVYGNAGMVAFDATGTLVPN